MFNNSKTTRGGQMKHDEESDNDGGWDDGLDESYWDAFEQAAAEAFPQGYTISNLV